MKTYLVTLFVLLLVACSAFKPVQDPSQVPSQVGVYTVETNVCGVPFVGTGGCLLGPNDDLSKKMIHILVPATNDQGKTATLSIVSKACPVNVSDEVQPGEDVAFTVQDLIQQQFLTQDCDLEITLIPQWEDQNTFTITVYPFIGRILLKTATNTPTSLAAIPSSAIGYGNGFIKITQRAIPPAPKLSRTGANASDTFMTAFQVNTGGSSAGQVVIVGCGFSLATAYSKPNPTIQIPAQSADCDFAGTVQRLDVAGDLSFYGSIDVYPSTYTLLAVPNVVVNKNGSATVSFDPLASAFSVDGKFYAGSTFKASKTQVKGAHYLRQMTTNGREASMYVVNGVIQWILQ